MYVIQFIKGGEVKVLSYLRVRLEKDGRFTANFEPTVVKRLPSIRVNRVRLVKAKPYCGQHPGECVVNPFLGPQKKKVGKWLEWDDWVKFHNLVNKALNRFRANAYVWSEPLECKGRMFIRRGLRSRVKWDWEERWDHFGRRIQEWNTGTDNQFGPPVGWSRGI